MKNTRLRQFWIQDNEAVGGATLCGGRDMAQKEIAGWLTSCLKTARHWMSGRRTTWKTSHNPLKAPIKDAVVAFSPQGFFNTPTSCSSSLITHTSSNVNDSPLLNMQIIFHWCCPFFSKQNGGGCNAGMSPKHGQTYGPLYILDYPYLSHSSFPTSMFPSLYLSIL